MSESMVERVCRALAKYDNPKHENWWPSYEGRARAAIEAMREMTDLMGLGLPEGYRPGSHSASEIWRALVRAALEEGK